MDVDIYNSQTISDYLKSVLSDKRRRHPHFTMRRWSQQMGLSQPALLSMALNGKRRITTELARKIKNTLTLSSDEESYFDALILCGNAKTREEEIVYQRMLKAIRPKKLAPEDVEVFSDWFDFAILDMVTLKGFRSDPAWIANKLKIEEASVKASLEKLCDAGLLARRDDGRIYKTQKHFQTPQDVSLANMRRIHRQLIGRAIDAMDRQPVSERSITGYTVSSSRQKIAEAKKRIEQFTNELVSFLDEEEGETLYQLNIQYYDLLLGESHEDD